MSSGPEDRPAVDAAPPPRQYARRTAPRYGAFVVTGALVGLVAAVLIALPTWDDGPYSTGTEVAYLGTILALLGGLAGGGLAVLFERRLTGRRRPPRAGPL